MSYSGATFLLLALIRFFRFDNFVFLVELLKLRPSLLPEELNEALDEPFAWTLAFLLPLVFSATSVNFLFVYFFSKPRSSGLP